LSRKLAKPLELAWANLIDDVSNTEKIVNVFVLDTVLFN
jgi:hypothetical protein